MNRIYGQSLATRIRDMEDGLNKFRITPIVNLGDWQEIAEPLEYLSANSLSVSNPDVDLRAMFAKGDPLRLKQGGAYKYFYVVSVSANAIVVRAGDMYTVSNAQITDVARGKKLNAIGFPVVFTFAPNLTSNGVGGLTGITYLRREFYIVGVTQYANIDVQFESTLGGQPVVYVDMPTPGYNYGPLGSVYAGDFVTTGSTFAQMKGYAQLEGGSNYAQAGIVALDTFNGSGQSINGQVIATIA